MKPDRLTCRLNFSPQRGTRPAPHVQPAERYTARPRISARRAVSGQSPFWKARSNKHWKTQRLEQLSKLAVSHAPFPGNMVSTLVSATRSSGPGQMQRLGGSSRLQRGWRRVIKAIRVAYRGPSTTRRNTMSLPSCPTMRTT